MDILKWLENFYLKCCDGYWEHIFGIKIGTLDNPGWSVDIDLEDTDLEKEHFEAIESERSEHDWVYRKVEYLKYKGRGGPANLEDILEIFRNWAVSYGEKNNIQYPSTPGGVKPPVVTEMNALKWLENFYLKCCDGYWEHMYGIEIGTLDNPGWSVRICLTDTDLEDEPFETIDRERSEHDWIHCRIKDQLFEGFGGPTNLEEILEIFRKWAVSHEKQNGIQADRITD